MKQNLIRGILVSMLLSMGTLYANESGEMKQELTIYGWLPSLDGTLTFKVPGEPDESASFNAIDSLDSVFMGSYSLRKNEWSFLADMIYLKMSGNTQGLNPNVHLGLELTAKLYSFYGGYNVSKTDKNSVDVIAGMRYLGLGLDVSRSGGIIANGSISADVDNYDAVIGVQGKYTIDNHWYIPYQVDIGTGDTDLTWQANLSIAYKLSWGDIIGTYRYIHYEQDDSLLIEDFDLYGPKIGVVFHF
ncbi:hypothetical protein [Sulfurovum sp.]|uniref:hypothetical protein n=1 Tax=Sulfurovum sp. TaxID=1969726 RepID=UPI0028683186|nr:hypothetical protein [Sulfurovum sp.]